MIFKNCIANQFLEPKTSQGTEVGNSPKIQMRVFPKKSAFPNPLDKEAISHLRHSLNELNRLMRFLRSVGEQAPREIWTNALQTSHDDEKFAFRLLFMLMCSSSTQDQQLISVMTSIFEDNDVTPEWVVKLGLFKLEALITSLGKQKVNSSNIFCTAAHLYHHCESKVPQEYHELCKFPGVGPKIASLQIHGMTGECPEIPVDVHVQKFSYYMGWSSSTEQDTCMKDLKKWVPSECFHQVNKDIGAFTQLLSAKPDFVLGIIKEKKIGMGEYQHLRIQDKLLRYKDYVMQKSMTEIAPFDFNI